MKEANVVHGGEEKLKELFAAKAREVLQVRPN